MMGNKLAIMGVFISFILFFLYKAFIGTYFLHGSYDDLWSAQVFKIDLSRGDVTFDEKMNGYKEKRWIFKTFSSYEEMTKIFLFPDDSIKGKNYIIFIGGSLENNKTINSYLERDEFDGLYIARLSNEGSIPIPIIKE